MGRSQFPPRGEPGQGAAAPFGHFRCRRCLLKGCEQFYRPSHPQSRYCSDHCRRESELWRRRRASWTWRASALGKRRRREQSRRYRQRIPLVVLPESYFTVQPAQSEPPSVTNPMPSATPVPETREGQRPASKSDDLSLRWCKRPGCYTVFAVHSAFSPQRFCSCGCRRALRNVLDREERYRRRRRDGYRLPRRHARPTSARPP